MKVITSIDGMRAFSIQTHRAGKTLGLVPTMGALHEGHFSLIHRAKAQCDETIVSIFVNPAQFGPSEDYDRYPRDLNEDIERLRPFNIAGVFAPSVEEMYPAGFETFVDPGPLAARLEGASRPGHFRGVATVVLKLFSIVGPDLAYFGQKDFQQTAVIRRMVHDLNLGVRLVVCPTVRDEDGLAISSRNAYLNSSGRESAQRLSRGLRQAQELVWNGETRAERVKDEIRQALGGDSALRLDYVEIVQPGSLAPVERITAGNVALAAAWIGPTRLIDNVIFGPKDASAEDLLQAAQGAAAPKGAPLHAPGLETESLRLQIQNCRDCAAISSVLLPPREFLLKYLRSDYPDLSSVRVLVIGRDAPWIAEHYLYRSPEWKDPFVSRLYELVGVSHFAEFKSRFALTDALRCHASIIPAPEKALGNCARHVREEIKLFPNLRTVVILGEAACLQFQRFILGRSAGEVIPLNRLLAEKGWAEEEVRCEEIKDRPLRLIYCHHPVGDYQSTPSIAQMLGEATG